MEPSHRIDAASGDEARQLLRTCCGSTAWVERMLRRRPFGNTDRLLAIAREVWFDLTWTDWLEAFSHHPRIGDRAGLARRSPDTARLSEHEQRGVTNASSVVLDELAAGNRAYEDRFGYIFIVCATGRSAEEMLELLNARLANGRDEEIRIAAGQQAMITALRLARLKIDSGG